MTTNIMQANVGKRAKLGLVNLLLLVLLIESIDVFVKNSISRRDKLTPKNKRGWNTSRKVQVWVIFSDSRVSSYCPTHHFLLGDLWVHFCSNQTGQDISRHWGKSGYKERVTIEHWVSGDQPDRPPVSHCDCHHSRLAPVSGGRQGSSVRPRVWVPCTSADCSAKSHRPAKGIIKTC